jgi:hypothetical protein
MFHFPTFPPHTLYIQATVTGHNSSWVSPFGHPRINARLPTPQGLSQAPTSFIGSWCQGIHRMLLVACQTPQRHTLLQKRCSRPLCSSQNTGRNPLPNPAYQTNQPGSSRRRRPTTKKPRSPLNKQGGRPIPQDPTACHDTPTRPSHVFPHPKLKGKGSTKPPDEPAECLKSMFYSHEQTAWKHSFQKRRPEHTTSKEELCASAAP